MPHGETAVALNGKLYELEEVPHGEMAVALNGKLYELEEWPFLSCGSPHDGHRVFLGHASLAACVMKLLSNPICGTAVEWDAANDGWCGCGRSGTSNADCDDEDAPHATSTVYRIVDEQ